MLKGFRDFVLRGNVLDLAVGVIIGGAFGTVVTSLVKDILTPIIGSLVGKPDFSAIAFNHIMIGNFLNAVFAFLLVAASVYFFIVLPANSLMLNCAEFSAMAFVRSSRFTSRGTRAW